MAIESTPELEALFDRHSPPPNRGEYALKHTPRDSLSVARLARTLATDDALLLKRGGGRHTFHDIRALCATKCPTIEIAMHLLGHSTSQ